MIRLILSTLLLLAALATGLAHAEDEFYVTAGFGKAELRHHEVNGHWYQLGYAYSYEEFSNAWKVGAGWQWREWLAFEADWRDLGQYNGVARFVSDKNYDLHRHRCRRPCEPTRTAWTHGTVRGLGLSMVASYPGTLTPFARVGVFAHHTKFRAFISRENSHYDRDLWVSKYKDGTERISARPFGGLGLRYKNIEAELTYYPRVGVNESAFKDATSLLISARF